MSTRITLQLRDPRAVASVLHRAGQEQVAEQINAQLRLIDREVREFAGIIETDLKDWSPEELRRMLHEFAENILAVAAVLQ